MKNKIFISLIVVLLIGLSQSLFAQNITFENPDFKTYLLDNYSTYDTNGDSEFTQEELDAITYLIISNIDLFNSSSSDILQLQNLAGIRLYNITTNATSLLIENIEIGSLDLFISQSTNVIIQNSSIEYFSYTNAYNSCNLTLRNIENLSSISVWEEQISKLTLENVSSGSSLSYQQTADTLVLINDTTSAFLEDIETFSSTSSLCEYADVILYHNTPRADTSGCANATEFTPGITTAIQPQGWTDGNGGIIMDLAELRWLSETPAAWDEDWLLGADIDATETRQWNISGNDTLGFSPIGNYTDHGYLPGIEFTGSFDGQGYEISNLFINRPNENYIGLFGCIISAYINNISLSSVEITGNNRVGSIIGTTTGYSPITSIIDCLVTGTIIGNNDIGGIVGYAESSFNINNCHFDGNVEGNKSVAGFVGHIMTWDGIIEKCSSKGEIIGSDCIGGFVGLDSLGYIKQCYTTCDVSGTGSNNWWGGIGGFSGNNFENSKFEDCFSTGNVTGDYIGGFVGNNGNYYKIKNCYSSGQLNENLTIGGFINQNNTTSSQYITSCYFDSLTAGVSYCIGEQVWGNVREDTAYAISTSDFANQSTFEGWNFDSIWTIALIPEIDSVPRPYLQWMAANYETLAIQPQGWTDGNGGIIMNLAELRWLSETPEAWDENWLLGDDIDASETRQWNISGDDTLGFRPIAYGSSFTGSFHGQGYTISNLYIKHTYNRVAGLFRNIEGATIDSLNILNARFNTGSITGILTGYSTDSHISNCRVSGSIICEDAAELGGLIGNANGGTVTNCRANINIQTANPSIGGLIGNASNMEISNCNAIGNIVGHSTIGGLIGSSTSSTITNSYSNCSVNGGNNTGGIIGEASETNIYRCYSLGPVTGADATGGLIGSAENTDINQCFATGGINNTTNIGGGLIGSFSGSDTITNCFSMGDVINYSNNLGGLIGVNTGTFLFSNCYTTCWVEGSDYSSIAAIAGISYNSIIESSYFDTTQTSFLNGANGDIMPQSFGLTTTEFANSDNFTNWDFDSIWVIATLPEFDPNPRPYLRWYLNTIETVAIQPQGWTDDNGGIIMNLAELRWLSETPEAWDENWLLGADIDAAETRQWNISGDDTLGFSPIGTNGNTPLTGAFNGQGYTISNLFINRPNSGSWSIGLFGYANSNIERINIENAHIVGGNNTGGIVGTLGYEAEYIRDCNSNGQIVGAYYTGGIVGNASNNISYINCSSDCDIIGENYLGGIVGISNEASIYQCSSRGSIHSTSTSNSTWNGVGGIIGQTFGTSIIESFSTSNISGYSHIGGIIGYGDVSNLIENCFYNGALNSTFSQGGLVGGAGECSPDHIYRNSYSAASYGANGDFNGYIIGFACEISAQTYTNIVFDNTDSLNLFGNYSIESAVDTSLVYKLATEDFSQQSNFPNWNFDSIWTIALIPEIDSVPRPYLQWMLPEINDTLSQSISLSSGINLITINRQPESSLVEDVFADIIDNVVEIRQAEAFYNPLQPAYINTLNTIESGQAYVVIMNSSAELVVEGEPIDPTGQNVQLTAGWNLLAYPYADSRDIDTVLSSIISNVEVVRSLDSYFIPTDDNSTLSSFTPGEAYFIKVSDNSSLMW